MSTATHAEAFDSPASEILEPPRRQTVGDPLVLGLPLIAVGAFALGLQVALSTRSDGRSPDRRPTLHRPVAEWPGCEQSRARGCESRPGVLEHNA
jgi:hypothetical protein